MGKVKEWFNNRENLAFFGILILAVIVRLYYFSIAGSQPIWWDESDYLAYAKNLAGIGGSWIVTEQHNSLYPFIVAILFKIGFGEVASKFILQVLPSILIVVLTYYIVKLMYKDSKIALISSFLMALFWVLLFNTYRFHVGVPGLLFGFLAIYSFWQGYERKEKIFGFIKSQWAVPLAVIFVILTYATRRGYFLFGAFFLIYMLLTRDFKSLVKDKYNWIGLGIAVVLFFLAESSVFSAGIGGVAGSYTHTENPINFLSFGVFSSYFGNPWNIALYLFWIGAVVLLFNVFMSIGHIKKPESGEVRADLFAVLSIIITMAFFVLILRNQNGFGEARWFFPLLLASLIAISRALVCGYNYLKKYNKRVAAVVLIVLVAFMGYGQWQQADNIIKDRVPSFSGVKEAGLYLNGVASEEDWIVSVPVPQVIYYSEREVLQPRKLLGVENNNVDFNDFINAVQNTEEVKWFLISFSEPNHADWMRRIGYVNHNGQNVPGLWEIPFMESSVNFVTGQQNILPEKQFGSIKFVLREIKQDVFIYEVVRV